MEKGKNVKDTKTCYCKKCHSEIPLSTAHSREGEDYIYHFCGEECIKKWEQSKNKKNE